MSLECKHQRAKHNEKQRAGASGLPANTRNATFSHSDVGMSTCAARSAHKRSWVCRPAALPFRLMMHVPRPELAQRLGGRGDSPSSHLSSRLQCAQRPRLTHGPTPHPLVPGIQISLWSFAALLCTSRCRPPRPHLCHTSAIPPRLLLILGVVLGVSSPSHSRLYTLASTLLQCPAIRERSNDLK